MKNFSPKWFNVDHHRRHHHFCRDVAENKKKSKLIFMQ